MNQSEYAKHLGISQQRVSKMLKQGIISRGVVEIKSGTRTVYDIDPKKADVDYEENRSLMNRPDSKPKGARKPKLTLPEMEDAAQAAWTGGITRADAERINAQYNAALKKLTYEERTGKVIMASEVAKDAAHAGRLVKERLTAIPARIAPLVAIESDPFQCEQVMKKEINQILEEISKEALK